MEQLEKKSNSLLTFSPSNLSLHNATLNNSIFWWKDLYQPITTFLMKLVRFLGAAKLCIQCWLNVNRVSIFPFLHFYFNKLTSLILRQLYKEDCDGSVTSRGKTLEFECRGKTHRTREKWHFEKIDAFKM